MCQLSIIVPVYNVQQYIADCLDSIVDLDLKCYEIIIVNDGSLDQSSYIIEEYRKKYPYIIKVVNQINQGLSNARNSGLKVALGKYILFVDSDDYVDGREVEKMLKIAIRDDLDVLYNDFLYCDENKRILPNTKYNMPNFKFSQTGIIEGKRISEFRILPNGAMRVEAWGQLYKRSFLNNNKITFIPGIYHEDVLFSFNVVLCAQKARYIISPLYFYRQRTGSIMSSSNKKKQLDLLNIIFTVILSINKNKKASKAWYIYMVSSYFSLIRHARIKNDIIYKTLWSCPFFDFISILKLIIIMFVNPFLKHTETVNLDE